MLGEKEKGISLNLPKVIISLILLTSLSIVIVASSRTEMKEKLLDHSIELEDMVDETPTEGSKRELKNEVKA